MKNGIRIVILLFFCAYSAFFVLGGVLAPLAAHFGYYEFSAKLTSTFIYSCHQEPDRCFWILGYPCALCARCLGFYFGVIIFAIVVLKDKLNLNLKNFLLLCLIVFADILYNYGFGVRTHNSGNILRFTIGIVMGLLFVVVLEFCMKGIKKKNV